MKVNTLGEYALGSVFVVIVKSAELIPANNVAVVEIAYPELEFIAT